MKPHEQTKIVKSTVERRTVLGWIGNATVLALGGDVLSACLGSNTAKNGRPDDAGSEGPSKATDAQGFGFQPGPDTDPIFNDWYENTVDAQNLVEILAGWKLTVDGMARKPLSLRFADVIALARQDQVTDFHCVEGWSVEDVPWNGVSLASMLDLAGADPSATYVSFYSVGGEYSESLPMSVAREPHTLLGYGVGGSTLPLAHGFPLRLVVPRLFGYKNAKYLSRIELTDHAITGYWEQYGYSYAGEVPASSLRPGKY